MYFRREVHAPMVPFVMSSSKVVCNSQVEEPVNKLK